MGRSGTSSKREHAAAAAVLRLIQTLKQPRPRVLVERKDIELILTLWQHREERQHALYPEGAA